MEGRGAAILAAGVQAERGSASVVPAAGKEEGVGRHSARKQKCREPLSLFMEYERHSSACAACRRKEASTVWKVRYSARQHAARMGRGDSGECAGAGDGRARQNAGSAAPATNRSAHAVPASAAHRTPPSLSSRRCL